MDTMEKSTLMSKISHVEKFHDAFRIGNRYNPTAVVPENEYMLRYNLIKEENEEYLDACKKGNIVEIPDALGDQLYILFGTVLRHGLQYKIEEVFDEIQRSNMSKLDEKGEPIFREDGKILKSSLYSEPNLKPILEK